MKFETNMGDPVAVHFDRDEADAHWARLKMKVEEEHFFSRALLAAEYHWHFIQGMEAVRRGLFIPGVSSLLNGIEASLRYTLKQISAPDAFEQEPSHYKLLSNRMLRDANALGLPVANLAFPQETGFLETIATEKGNPAELVRVRNNICHGNVFEFIQHVEEAEARVFTPDALRPLALTLLGMTARWAKNLGDFRMAKALRHPSTGPIPAIPPTLASL